MSRVKPAAIRGHWLGTGVACGSLQIRRIEIILAGNPDQRKKRVSSRVGECGTHAAWRGNFTDGAHGPIRGDPLSRCVRQYCREIDEASRLINRRGLHGRNFVLAQDFAHDLEPAGKRCVAKRLLSPVPTFLADGRYKDFSGLVSSVWALARQRLGRQSIYSPAASLPSALRRSKLIAPDFERLARRPWPKACCASAGTRLFNSALAASCSR